MGKILNFVDRIKKPVSIYLESNSSDDELPTPTAIKPRILYTPNGDQILELTIETLMGTTFEVRLPAKTLVASIKNRLQRSEGVPKHHLHIIHSGL